MPNVITRHARVVIAGSATLVAAGIWMVLVLKMGMSHAEAVLIVALALLAMAQLHVFLDRARDVRRVRAEIDDILAATGELLGDVAALREDLRAMGQRLGEKNYLHADRLAGQVAALEEMIARLAEGEARREVFEAGLEVKVAEFTSAAARRQPARPQVVAEPERVAAARTGEHAAPVGAPAVDELDGDEAVAAAPAAADAAPAPEPAPAPAEAAAKAPDLALVRSVESAVAEHRADVYLQPIVTLPQRKVRFYEALTRLRDDDGCTILPGDYLGPAGEAGVLAEIDAAVLARSLALVRRFAERRRDIGVFCNLSTASLGEPQMVPGLIEQIEAQGLAGSLVLEFAQAEIAQIGPLEEESLTALAGHGLRFSLDHVRDLGIDFPSLAAQGFRYVKVDAARLLDVGGAASAPVHPEDLARLAARSGIKLIAEKIEHEATVVNLLDHEVSLAQGYLFARPRLVREDAVPTRAAA